MPSTPRSPVSPIRSAPDCPEGRISLGVVAARLGVVMVAAAGMAGLTVAAAGAAGPAGAAGSTSGRPGAGATAAARSLTARNHRAGTPPQVHIEAVSTPVLVTAAEMEQAVSAQQAASTPAAAPAPPPPATPPTPSPPPTTSHSVSAAPTSSSSGGTGTDLGTFMVTCYDIHGQTASGDQAGPQSVAVDPSVIPLGTEIYIAGVGYRRADDTGGGIQGHHIDIWEPTYSDCAAFGRQYRDVHRAS